MLATADRGWLLTIDFEAFDHEGIRGWLEAMRLWSSLSHAGNWRFSLFLALEDVVRLRATDGSSYDAFLRVAKELHEAGNEFYPHNHGVFDSKTGLLAAVRPQLVPGYGNRASFAYDVLHRHGRDLAEWIGRVLAHYDNFLADAGIRRPERLAFRAGGWDHGDTKESTRQYIRALEGNSFSFDSSASAGTFGEKGWDPGVPFGSNVFALSDSLVEVAPCWSLNCGRGLASRDAMSSAWRLVHQSRVLRSRRSPGAFVTVLHFDHLFGPDLQRSPAGRTASRAIEKRVTRFFRVIGVLRKTLNLRSTTFEDLELKW
jgi:hypothetical protein